MLKIIKIPPPFTCLIILLFNKSAEVHVLCMLKAEYHPEERRRHFPCENSNDPPSRLTSEQFNPINILKHLMHRHDWNFFIWPILKLFYASCPFSLLISGLYEGADPPVSTLRNIPASFNAIILNMSAGSRSSEVRVHLPRIGTRWFNLMRKFGSR